MWRIFKLLEALTCFAAGSILNLKSGASKKQKKKNSHPKFFIGKHGHMSNPSEEKE